MKYRFFFTLLSANALTFYSNLLVVLIATGPRLTLEVPRYLTRSRGPFSIMFSENEHKVVPVDGLMCHNFGVLAATPASSQVPDKSTLALVHYSDVIMSTIASLITSLAVVYSTVYSDADQRKHQSSASLAFVWGIHRDRWIPRTKGQLRGKCFHLMTSSWWKLVSVHWQ